jgi:hypothetical protein
MNAHRIVLVLCILGLTACSSGTTDADTTDVKEAETTDIPITPDEGDVTDTTICEPLCLDNWACGPDGCGGVCGLCATGFTCKEATHTCEDTGPPPEDAGTDGTSTNDPNICTGSIANSQPFGGSCCYTAVAHPENPDCVWYSDGFGSGACIHAQCDTALCVRGDGFCSKPCTLIKDVVNNVDGEPGADGIEDEEYNECAGAVDGPAGTVFRCVNKNEPNQNPQGQCLPGTTFADCDSNTDCTDGEFCQLIYIHALYQTRCMIPTKDAAKGTEECNSNPNNGPVQYCTSGFCTGSGCMDLCADDSSCLTDVCEAGKCTKNDSECTTNSDCSAWTCENIKPYSNSEYMDDFCQPRECFTIGGCHDPDWFCRPFWNGADKVEDVAFSPKCRRKDVGTASYGESCGVEGDGSGLPSCVWGNGCIDNMCSGPCQSDADCSDGRECLLAYEWDIDVDDDNNTDTTVNVDICLSWPHTSDLTECTTDADCPTGDHCEYRVKGDGAGADRVWKAQYYCKSDYNNQVGFGEECGTAVKKECASNLCLVPSNSDAKYMCTKYCSSSTDCPSTFEFDDYGYKSVCLSFHVNSQNTPDPVDDVFVPYCWRTSPFASVKSCEETRQCANNKEYCRPIAIAGNPDEKVTVEHLCIDMGYGLSAYPTLELGEPCTGNSKCKSRSCITDAEGNGYCSSLCLVDADCQNETMAGLVCTDVEVLPRPDKTNSGWTKRCLLEALCAPCQTDNDCGGAYVCANFGGIGLLADFRCGKPCDLDASNPCNRECVEGFCNQDPAAPCTEASDCALGLCTLDAASSCDNDVDCSVCNALELEATCLPKLDSQGKSLGGDVCVADQCPAK